MFDFENCEKAIDYTFKDKNLLMQCFTHSSFSNEHKNFKNNERLEFLGDSVMGFIVTDYLFKTHLDFDEGMLTKEKQSIVSKEPLSNACINNGFNNFLILGEGVKNQHNNKNLCENLFESIVAGIYLDSGIDDARKFVEKFLLHQNNKSFNYKGALQELAQERRLGEICYVDVDEKGPKHNLLFTCIVTVGGKTLGKGEGTSKQKAQQICARQAYNFLLSQK